MPGDSFIALCHEVGAVLGINLSVLPRPRAGGASTAVLLRLAGVGAG